ncbi:MAG: MurR/RpiR family transcriptional regulator [Oscillospiraceae bacterium]|nr:MurR/RpiR family transcriptional regulator [bacterium]MDY5100755.1 MurR/RpiR family transcriptional regulator [Oscillospiraceae bacterium]
MERDILALINKENRRFSKGQKQIAKFITENYDKAAFMTADKLGRTVGVSESTVVRFASELGYDGYPGMRKAMQDMVRNRLTAVQRIEVAKETIGQDNILNLVLSSDIDKLQSTLDEVDPRSFDQAVKAILNAKTIYIVGMRSSTALASFMGFYLNQMLENVRLVHDTSVSEVYEQVFRIGEGDVFIGISYPRYSSKTIKAMEFAKSTGATAIGITDGDSSPFVGVADVILYAKSDMVSFLDSLVAPMSLINALIVAVGYQRPDNLSDTYHRLEKIWSEYDVYEKLDD